MVARSFCAVLLSALLLPALAVSLQAAEAQPSTVAGLPPGEALRLGERMYRDGILPSGEPMMAVVEGDITVEGTMFTCISCHLRSGLGSNEGTVFTPPTNGAKLYKPLPHGQGVIGSPEAKLPKEYAGGDVRPAYTDKTLAAALMAGVDPAGRKFDYVMPRYMLSDRDAEIMVFYLKNLSAAISPGVTDTTLRFATVITEEVPPKDRDAMIAPLEAYFRDRTSQSRHQEKRARHGGPFREEMYSSYRKIVLSRWELKGAPETWRGQVEEYYGKEPVFALAGGITTRSWEPIHRFCEERKIPCIFPVTDYPVIADSDWYTLYFSKGLYQEGEAAARYLRSEEIPETVPVVQVFRNTREGRVLAEAFRETRRKLGLGPPEERMLSDEPLTPAFWRALADAYPSAVVALWLPPKDLADAAALSEGAKRPAMLFMAASLLDASLYTLPEQIRPFTYIAYPYRLPQEKHRNKLVVENWLKVRNIPVTDFAIQSKMYFVGWMLSEALMMMQSDFYRDYFLDVIDMAKDQTYAIVTYPRVSFGPGQRYASKGCYIVQLSGGPEPELVRKSEWVIH
ncbi:MAG: amino acid ABC transporter substrate-binding protein [Nitrospirota bacterium]